MDRVVGLSCDVSGTDDDTACGVQTLSAKRFESGRIVVDNEAEPDLTVVTINERKESSAALLDVASAMTGIGVLIHEAIIQVELLHLSQYAMRGSCLCIAFWGACCAPRVNRTLRARPSHCSEVLNRCSQKRLMHWPK